MLKAVIDTNVLISGLIKSPLCRKIIRELEKSSFIPVVSPAMLDELVDVLSRSKFHNVIKKETAEELLKVIHDQALLVRPTIRLNVVTDDPDDNCFLEAAITAGAFCVVSLDPHLLSLEFFENVRILTPNVFLDELNNRNS